jgi:DNA-binding NarL/FixJ family response regulator
MAGNIKTHLICFDDHRGFAEDVRKRFSDTSKYIVTSFPTREEFIGQIEKERENNYCKIAILGMHDTREQFEMIEKLTMEIKKIDLRTCLILLGPPEKIEEIRRAVKFNIDAYIPKNANSVFRIHNAVRKLMSEHALGVCRRRRNISLYVLLTFILLCVLLILAAYFRFPDFF